MGFHASTGRSQLKVYFQFSVLPIAHRLVARGTAPGVRFRFVALPSALRSVVGGICFRFSNHHVGRCIGVLIALLFLALASILLQARNLIFQASLKSAISN